MTEQEKQAINERLSFITEGKWFTYYDESTIVGSFENHTDTPVADCGKDMDAIFIAHAPQDIRNLLDALDERDQEVERLKEQLEGRKKMLLTSSVVQRLSEDNQRLQKALKSIVMYYGFEGDTAYIDMKRIAQKALSGEEK